LFLAATGLAFVPTLITRAIVFGGFFRFGSYSGVPWDWTAPNWRLVLYSSEHGLLSWTPILVLSSAGLFLAPRFAKRVLLLFVLWNVGLIFQWGAHLIPTRGPISFSEVAHNQVFVVPRELSADICRYFFKRKALMQQIEQRDLKQLEKNPAPP
jgi:hypothetical protein